MQNVSLKSQNDHKKLNPAPPRGDEAGFATLAQSIGELDDSIEKSLAQNGFWPTLWHGLVGAVGSVIGTTIAITLFVLLLQKLTGVPFVGHYVTKIIQGVQQNK